MSPSLFVPEGAFEVLVRQQIARLLEPSLDCAYQVYEELRRIVIEIDLPELSHFYKLNSKICDVMENVLDKCLTPTTDMIMNMMEIENAVINTNHPDFVGSADSLLNLFSDDQSNPADGNVQSQSVTDGDGQPINKTYSLLKEEKKESQDLDDFQDIEHMENIPAGQGSDDKNQNGEKAQMNSNANQELKNSMFENVFGYKSQVKKGKEEEVKQINTGVQSSQQYVPGIDLNNPVGITLAESRTNLPEIILSQIPVNMRASADQESARVIMETRVIQNLIFSYFNIVKKNISDMVPKTVMAFLVNDSRRNAHSELVAQIYKAGDLESLLVEDPMVVEQRERTKKVIKALRQAQEILAEVAKYDI